MMMLNHHLKAEQLQLKAAQEWSPKGEGIVLVLPTEGSGHYKANGITQPLAPGQVLVFNPSAHGTLRNDGTGSSLVFQAFSLRLDHLYPLLISQEISALQGVAEAFKSARAYPAASLAAQQCHQLLKQIPAEFNLDHRLGLLRIAATLLSAEFAQAQSARSAKTQLPPAFQKLAPDDLVHLSVGELAAKLGCSRRHLNRLFRQQFGLSAVSMRMEVRLLRAASLLRNPDAKVINVAEECGFNHLGLFNTCFKRRFHKSPSQWRRLAQEPMPAAGKKGQCPMQSSGFCAWPEI